MKHWNAVAAWLRRRRHPDPPSGEAERELASLLDARATRVRGADPETRNAWSRLERSLTSGARDRKRIPVSVRVLRPAIVLPVLAMGIALAVLLTQRQPAGRVFETTRGQHTSILLADSTEVLLNHTSRISIQNVSPGSDRKVVLEGEAFFRVRHNGSPFIVSTGSGTIRVLGTEFNVRSRSERLEVAVTRGSVRVSSSTGRTDGSVVLGPSQLAVCRKGSPPEGPTSFPAGEYPGWIQDRLVFHRADLRSVCSELEDQFDVRVTIARPDLAAETITGTLDGRSIGNSLAALAALTGHSYRYENSAYILY